MTPAELKVVMAITFCMTAQADMPVFASEFSLEVSTVSNVVSTAHISQSVSVLHNLLCLSTP
jgi:hypothetical protein